MPDIDEDTLEHFGVKGQKWGVRNEKRLERANSVADGSASLGKKTAFFLTDTSRAAINRNKGLAGAAGVRAAELQGRKDRITAGKGTAKDLIALHGGDRLWISGKGPKALKEKTPKNPDTNLRAAQNERKRLLETGQITQQQYNAGTAKFGRNLAVAIIGGAAVGAGIGKLITG